VWHTRSPLHRGRKDPSCVIRSSLRLGRRRRAAVQRGRGVGLIVLRRQRQRSCSPGRRTPTRSGVERDGSQAVRLTSPPSGYGDSVPRFSADGTKVVFWRLRSGGATEVWTNACRRDGADRAHRGPGERQQALRGDLLARRHPGAVRALRLGSGRSDGIFAVPAGGGGSATPLTTGNDHSPASSPDGTKLAFIRSGTNVNDELMWPRPTGEPGARVHVVGQPARRAELVAGRQAPRGAGRSQPLGADRASSGVDPVAPLETPPANTFDRDPAYAPDGTKVIFTRFSGQTAASTRSLPGAGRRRRSSRPPPEPTTTARTGGSRPPSSPRAGP